MTGIDIQKGGAFLVEEAGSKKIFIPEYLSIEQRELSKAVFDFVAGEVIPHEELIEEMMPGLMPKLLREAAKLGILSAEVPEEYGGLSLGKIDATAMAEGAALQGSFNVAYMCHTGIATAPLIYYGTKRQKEKYLAKLAGGEMLGSFALTEPDAGSDAMAMKTGAILSKDKKYYILNGQKQFITNGGFADLFTVFAKIDEGITAFLVERTFKGFTVGKEEKKMGIRGSSTVSFTMDDVKVPVENLLGEIGKGHHIAFNILNLGRLKLGAACIGVSKHLVNLTRNYVTERVQFSRPLISFQLIQEKLAEMVARTFILDSLIYRASAACDAAVSAAKDGDLQKSLKEYAIESSIAKVYGSETICSVVDDAVQLHGGYGYCEEYGIERYYRDARINRIFEGTNEINRLLIAGTILKMAVKGQLDILSVISTAPQKINELITGAGSDEEGRIFAFIEIVKRLLLSAGGAAVQKFADKISDEEFILGSMADMVIEIYAVESAYLRAKQLKDDGNIAKSKALFDALYLYVMKTAVETLTKGRNILMRSMPLDSKEVDGYTKAMFGVTAFLKGDKQKYIMGIIDKINEAVGYPF